MLICCYLVKILFFLYTNAYSLFSIIWLWPTESSILVMASYLKLQKPKYHMVSFLNLLFVCMFFPLLEIKIHSSYWYLNLWKRDSFLSFIDKGLFPHWCKGFDVPVSHNISEHLSKLHKHSVITMSAAVLLDMRIKSIKRVLRKQ